MGIRGNDGSVSNFARLSHALSSWTALVLDRRWAVLAVLAAISICAVSQLRNIKTVVDLTKILPQSDRFVIAGDHIREQFGGIYSLMIGIRFSEGTVCTPKNFSKLEDISKGLTAETPELIGTRIVSIVSPLVDDIRRSSEDVVVANLADAIRPSSDSDVYRCMVGLDRATDLEGILWDQGRRTAIILIEFSDKKGGYKDLIDSVRAAIDKRKDRSFAYLLGGNVAYIAETERYSERVPGLLGGAIVVIGLLFYASFAAFRGSLSHWRLLCWQRFGPPVSWGRSECLWMHLVHLRRS